MPAEAGVVEVNQAQTAAVYHDVLRRERRYEQAHRSNRYLLYKPEPDPSSQPERCLLINCMSVAVFQIIQPLDVLILVVGVYVEGVAAFSQVHQNPGGILQTAKITHVIPVIVGQHDGVEVFQRNMVWQPR